MTPTQISIVWWLGAIAAVLVLVIVVGLVIAGLWYYKTELPLLVDKFASRHQWILRLEEQGYAVLMQGNAFYRGILQYAGHHLSDDTERATILEDVVGYKKPGRPLLGPDTSFLDFLENVFARWFDKAFPGYTWIGFGFNGDHGTIRLGKVKVRKLGLRKTQEEGTPVSNMIEDRGVEEVIWLAPEFPRYLFIPNVESRDGYIVGYLNLFKIVLTVPYRTHQGNGGRSYGMLDEMLKADWRGAAQHGTTLPQLYHGVGEEVITLRFFGTTTVTANVDNKIVDSNGNEVSPPPDIPGPLEFADLGVKVIKAEVVDWEDNAGPKFRETMQAATLAKLEEIADLAQLARRKKVAEVARPTLEAEGETADKERLTNSKIIAAMRELVGDNPQLMELLETMVLARKVTPDQFRLHMMRGTFKQLRFLVDGGVITEMLGKIAGPQTQTTTPKDGDKKKDKK